MGFCPAVLLPFQGGYFRRVFCEKSGFSLGAGLLGGKLRKKGVLTWGGGSARQSFCRFRVGGFAEKTAEKWALLAVAAAVSGRVFSKGILRKSGFSLGVGLLGGKLRKKGVLTWVGVLPGSPSAVSGLVVSRRKPPKNGLCWQLPLPFQGGWFLRKSGFSLGAGLLGGKLRKKGGSHLVRPQPPPAARPPAAPSRSPPGLLNNLWHNRQKSHKGRQMSSIGSIHFVQQNQTYPAMEHARALAKSADVPEELAPQPEVPTVDASSESAAANEDFEHDYTQKEREQGGKKQQGGKNADENDENDDDEAGGVGAEENDESGENTAPFAAQADFFGTQIYGNFGESKSAADVSSALAAAHRPHRLDKSV